jgi:hypothetical protein
MRLYLPCTCAHPLAPLPPQDSIKNSQSWFLACQQYAPGMARTMADRALQLSASAGQQQQQRQPGVNGSAPGSAPVVGPDGRPSAPAAPAAADKVLHLVYLVNDIVFKAFSARKQGQGPADDPLAVAFAPVLGAMLAAALCGGRCGRSCSEWWLSGGSVACLTLLRWK